jgi:hypothetical protein
MRREHIPYSGASAADFHRLPNAGPSSDVPAGFAAARGRGEISMGWGKCKILARCRSSEFGRSRKGAQCGSRPQPRSRTRKLFIRFSSLCPRCLCALCANPAMFSRRERRDTEGTEKKIRCGRAFQDSKNPRDIVANARRRMQGRKLPVNPVFFAFSFEDITQNLVSSERFCRVGVLAHHGLSPGGQTVGEYAHPTLGCGRSPR